MCTLLYFYSPNPKQPKTKQNKRQTTLIFLSRRDIKRWVQTSEHSDNSTSYKPSEPKPCAKAAASSAPRGTGTSVPSATETWAFKNSVPLPPKPPSTRPSSTAAPPPPRRLLWRPSNRTLSSSSSCFATCASGGSKITCCDARK